MLFELQMVVCILAFLLQHLAQARPTPTASSQTLLSAGISPRPTDEAVLVKPFRELKRQAHGDSCGYATGTTQYPVTCAVGYKCAVNTMQEAMGCCPEGNSQYSQLATACVEYTNLHKCDDDCQADFEIGKCNYQYPHCATFHSLSGTTTFTGYQCATSPSLIVTVQTAADNLASTLSIKTIAATSVPSTSLTASPIVYYQTIVDISAVKHKRAAYDKSKGGLSEGELVGIIIGAIAAFIALVTLIVMCQRSY